MNVPTVAEQISAFGPQGKAVVSLVERAGLLTDDERLQLSVVWSAAKSLAEVAAEDAVRDLARGAARDYGRVGAWIAARDVAGIGAMVPARDATRDAACALVVRDLISADHFEVLTGPWREVIGPTWEVTS